MKIHDTQSVKRINPYSNQYTQNRQIDTGSKQKKLDEVSISDEALRMSQGTDEIGPNSQTVNSLDRADRINQLKQSIQDGSYQVSASDVAKKVYDSFVRRSDT